MKSSGMTIRGRDAPSAEALERGQASRAQGDDGLVVETELSALDGAAQLGLQAQASQGARVHAVVEDLEGGWALQLGAMHGGMGVAEERLRLGVGRRCGRDADGGGGKDLLAPDGHGTAESGAEAVGHADEIVRLAEVVHEDGELIAAEVGERVLGPDAGREPSGHGGEEVVSREMAEAVVDALEAVEVEDEDPEQSGPSGGGRGPSPGGRGQEERPVGRPVRGRAGWRAQLLFRAPPVGDVEDHGARPHGRRGPARIGVPVEEAAAPEEARTPWAVRPARGARPSP